LEYKLQKIIFFYQIKVFTMKPVLALILIALSFNTHAALIFDINITSATTAVITGSGTLDEPNPLNYGYYLAFDDVFDAVSPWNPNLSSDNNMTLGGHALWTSFYGLQDNNTGFETDLYTMGLNHGEDGDVLVGTATLDLGSSSFTFSATNFSGNVYDAQSGGNIVGTWSTGSVTVSEPSIIVVFALGLVGIGFARRRQS
jgi:hypothetical protein